MRNIIKFVVLIILLFYLIFLKKKGTCKCDHYSHLLKSGMVWLGAHLDNNETFYYLKPQLSAHKCDRTRRLPTIIPPSWKAVVILVLPAKMAKEIIKLDRVVRRSNSNYHLPTPSWLRNIVECSLKNRKTIVETSLVYLILSYIALPSSYHILSSWERGKRTNS